MTRLLLRALLAFFLVSSLAPVSAAEPPPIEDPAAVIAKIRPEPSELAWAAVPWRATLWDAVIEAQKVKKPILLWAMNGHALACT